MACKQNKIRNNLFLIGTLTLVLFLTAIKFIYYQNESLAAKHPAHTPRFRMESIAGELPTHRFRIMTNLITNKQFHAFVLATEYLSWREKQDLQPTWKHTGSNSSFSWQTDPNKPVLWLTRKDAEAFCLWFANRTNTPSPYSQNDRSSPWQHEGFRLPTVEELEAIEVSIPFWEWTLNDLSDFDKQRSNTHQYLTAYKNKSLRHRRHIDNDIATGFRIAWTLY